MKVAQTTNSQIDNDHSSLVYSSAHDLRSPLMSVKGLIHLMQLDSEKKNLYSYFCLLEKSVEKMDQAITDIITHSQMGTEEIDLQQVEFKDIVEECISQLKYMPEAGSVHISLSIEEGGLFFSNRKRLISIFNNIISNAIRYQDENKRSFLKISVIGNHQGCTVTFEDNGIGIAPEIIEKVFDKYFLLNRAKGGTGLGLHLVKTSIRAIGGKMQLSSSLGKGSTFTAQVPNLIAQMGV